MTSCPHCGLEIDSRAKVKIPEIPWKHENGRWVKIKEDADFDPILEEYR
jgi:hypothetical protein